MLEQNMLAANIELPGTLYGITTFFNPQRYSNKSQNYRIFREHSKRQGLKLLTIELAYDDYPFELHKEHDAEILIQVRGEHQNMLWQKERLLNLGLQKLPSDCDKVLTIDADIIFKNENWLKQTEKLLTRFMVVQPFQFAVSLSRDVLDLEEDEIRKLPQGENDLELTPGGAYGRQNYVLGYLHPGYAWAFRRTWIESHGFYDKDIVGASDTAMWSAMYADFQTFIERSTLKSTAALNMAYLKWAQPFSRECNGRVGSTPGTILHLWHGSRKERLYVLRHHLLTHFNFDPAVDISIDSNGLWRWSENKMAFADAFQEYFAARNETGERKGLYHVLIEEIDALQIENDRLRNLNFIVKTKSLIVESIYAILRLDSGTGLRSWIVRSTAGVVHSCLRVFKRLSALRSGR